MAERQREHDARRDREEGIRESGDGAILHWLILGPIPYPGSERQALDYDPFGNEARLQPQPGDRVTINHREYSWKAATLTSYIISFNQIIEQPAENCIFYAVAYLRAPRPLTGLPMLVGMDDFGQIYLNGERVHRYLTGASLTPDRDTVPDVSLKAGVNSVVFKIINGPGHSHGCIRFTDGEDQPVLDFESTFSP